MADSNSKPKPKSMFRKFWLDVILGTVFIFSVMGLFASVTAFRVFDLFDPIGEAFADMEMTDVVFSQLRETPTVDDRVVLVNIGNRSRFEIAMMVDSINQHDPLAIGMDIFFLEPKLEDSLGDALLAQNLGKVNNLVMPLKALCSDSTDACGGQVSWDPFNTNADLAHVNLITDAKVQEDLKMCREFPPSLPIDDTSVPAFAVQLASYFDADRANAFLESAGETEVINYRGNIIDYGATEHGNMFFALDHYEILEPYYDVATNQFYRMYDPSIITGKIIIFCYMGEHLADREALEDRYFTPLNVKYIGRAHPDMFGGVIHANIITMILNDDFIGQLKAWQSWIIAIIICFVNVMAFSWVYKKIPRWYDGVTKLIQLLEFGTLVFLMIYVMEFFSLKLDLTYALFAVALVGDGLEVYYGVVKNSFTREGRKELFRVSKI